MNACRPVVASILFSILLIWPAIPASAAEPPGQFVGVDLHALLYGTSAEQTFGQSWQARDVSGLPSPRGALVRSLAVPGWGQIYNGQYLKAPIVVGVLATLVGASVYSHGRADLFRRAAIYHDCTNQPGSVPGDFCEQAPAYEPDFLRADALTAGPLTGTSARTLRDGFRRQRDLFVLFSVLAYGLQALDAYVAAELADFDTGEDLVFAPGALPSGPSIQLRWRF